MKSSLAQTMWLRKEKKSVGRLESWKAWHSSQGGLWQWYQGTLAGLGLSRLGTDKLKGFGKEV